MKQKCSSCHNKKLIEEFPLTKKGNVAKNCLACQEVKRKYVLANKEEIKRKRKEYYEKNKSSILEKMKKDYDANTEKHKEKNKKSYEKHKDKNLEYKKEYYLEHQEHYIQLARDDRKNNPEKYLWKAAKKRAKEKSLPFNIAVEDIVIPDNCPVFGFPLEAGSMLERWNSPSLDKIIPELGYVKDNIKVISFKANTLKRDGHIEDFEKIISYIKCSIKE